MSPQRSWGGSWLALFLQRSCAGASLGEKDGEIRWYFWFVTEVGIKPITLGEEAIARPPLFGAGLILREYVRG